MQNAPRVVGRAPLCSASESSPSEVSPHLDPQRAFEVETYGFTVLESVIDAEHARELAEAVSAADARIGTD